MLDTQDTWLEAQVVALDPPEASRAAETELRALRTAFVQARNHPGRPVPPVAHQFPTARRILVHYKSFHSKYDEWLDVSCDSSRDMVCRIALLHTHTRIPHPILHPRPFSQIGELVDCKDTINQWHRARIVDFHDARQQALVHYEEFSEKFDEWINGDSYRLQQAGSFKQGNIMTASSSSSSSSSSVPVRQLRGHQGAAAAASRLAHPSTTHTSASASSASSAAATPAQIAQFQASAANELRFRELMRNRLQSEIVDQKEDGNCQLLLLACCLLAAAASHVLCLDCCVSSSSSYAEPPCFPSLSRPFPPLFPLSHFFFFFFGFSLSLCFFRSLSFRVPPSVRFRWSPFLSTSGLYVLYILRKAFF